MSGRPLAFATWDESLHPRTKDGKFGAGLEVMKKDAAEYEDAFPSPMTQDNDKSDGPQAAQNWDVQKVYGKVTDVDPREAVSRQEAVFPKRVAQYIKNPATKAAKIGDAHPLGRQ